MSILTHEYFILSIIFLILDDDCKLNDINFVKVGDEKEVSKLGMDESPVLVYYENGIPNLYDGSLGDDRFQ